MGRLGDKTCCHCDALLYEGEATKKSKMKPGEWRGCSCCSDGQVDLPAVEGCTRVDDLWCGKEGEDAAKAKLLHAHARKFNNALALAYEQVEEPEVESGGWQPSVVIQGKLYHKIGPLQAEEGEVPKFAQLYVHDPSADDDIADQRSKHMYLPSTMSRADRVTMNSALKINKACASKPRSIPRLQSSPRVPRGRGAASAAQASGSKCSSSTEPQTQTSQTRKLRLSSSCEPAQPIERALSSPAERGVTADR